MRIGIFGGTFDPPHLGHLILASESVDQLALDKLLWVVTATPPHKLGQVISPLEDRLQLNRAAIDDNPEFELSRVDIDRPGPHYSVDTLRILKRINPGDEMIFLIGGDSLRDLPTWHTPDRFVCEADEIGVFRRPGDGVELTDLERILPGLTAKVHYVEAPLLEISSSQIRQRVREGRPYRYYVPQAVYNLIAKKGLYRGND